MQQQKSQHQYSTRTRHNVEIRPSHRLGQSPEPLASPTAKTSPFASDTIIHAPTFPPPHIVLHPDDANSRVFLAIGRSFLSVDNRAMTIKDLADMTVKFGLVCQNVSAASQAITTYIRLHMQRCEAQQDTPLLLKHSLSGTSMDDDLLPALYSRSGGAHCTSNPENRITNFRRGTMVWYLSRATGAPCPFARAGIRLCDYADSSKVQDPKLGSRKLVSIEEQSCGQKRKRLLRTRLNPSDDDSDSPSEDAQRPPKVKLTLRLKPLKHASEPRDVIDPTPSSDSDDSMSSDSSSEDDDDEEHKIQEEESWSLPPYPRRSISIPSYTPCLATFSPYPFYSDSPSTSSHQYRRSPSVPYSIGSPPPDSDDEDDFSIAMTRPKPFFADGLRASTVNDWDSDGDGETIWESPGPRSPSAPAPLVPHADNSDLTVTIKQEPRDVQSMLDAWDDYDSFTASDDTLHISTEPVKLEIPSPSLWDWDNGSSEWSSPLLDDFFAPSSPCSVVRAIKEEDMDYADLLAENSLAPSTVSAPSEGSLTLSKAGARQVKWDDENESSIANEVASPSPPQPSAQPLRLELPILPSLPFGDPSQSPTLASLASLIQSMSMSSPTAVSPAVLRLASGSPVGPSVDPVVVYTCSPCTPTVSATQVEGISVYQMTLGSSRLLRRIDTDFVNLTPIATYASIPVPNLSTGIVVNKGSIAVAGTWVPLSAAQTFVQSCLSPLSRLSPSQQSMMQPVLDIFLSSVLFERFPTALQDFHRSSTSRRILDQFGPHFHSTLAFSIAEQHAMSSSQHSLSSSTSSEQVFSLLPSLSWTPRGAPRPCDANSPVDETPLSQREQEIFQTLCADPEWEQDASLPADPAAEICSESSTVELALPTSVATPESHSAPLPDPATEVPAVDVDAGIPASNKASAPVKALAKQPPSSRDRPLRRSKRVADALATKTQTRSSRRRGSTKSLS